MSNNRLVDLSTFDATAHTKLEVLDVSGNQLRDIMEVEWSYLTQLNTLDIGNNDIASPPYQLGFLPALEKLSLVGNPTRTIRQALITGPTSRLKEHLRMKAPVS